MKQLVLFGVMVLLLVAIQFSNGKTVDEIIEKHIRAKGGFASITAIQSICMEGMLSVMGHTAIIQFNSIIDAQQPDLFHTHWQAGESEEWVKEPAMAAWLDAVLKVLPLEPYAINPLINHFEKQNQITLLGKVVEEDNRLYKIQLTTHQGRELVYAINAATFLLTHLTEKNAAVSSTSLRTHFSDYKPVAGLMVAHALRLQPLGGLEHRSIDIVFNKITIQ